MVFKYYSFKKIKTLFKLNYFIFFIQNFNLNKIDFLPKKTYIKNLKIVSSSIRKIFDYSIQSFVLELFLQFSIVSLVKNKKIKKTILKKMLYSYMNNILCVKLNNRIYSAYVLKKSFSFNYSQTKSLLCKFLISCLKKFIS